MADIRSTKRAVYTILTILLAFNGVALAVLLSPLGRNTAAHTAEIDSLNADLQAKTREVVPLTGIDKKVDEARGQIDSFYQERLPASYSDAITQLGKLAASNGVQLADAGYKTSEQAPVQGILEVSIQATLTGDYVNQMKFVNAVERSKTLFIVDSVKLAEEPQGGGVRLEIVLQTYIRNA